MSTIKTIWNSDFDVKDYLKSYLEFNGMSEEEYEKVARAHESDLYEHAYCENNLVYEDELINIRAHEALKGEKLYVVKATIERWNGLFDGGKIITGMSAVFAACTEEDTHIYLNGKKMEIRSAHHDGTNMFYIKELTEEGQKFYEKNKDELTDREMVESLFNDHHKSRHVTIWYDMYGM